MAVSGWNSVAACFHWNALCDFSSYITGTCDAFAKRIKLVDLMFGTAA